MQLSFCSVLRNHEGGENILVAYKVFYSRLVNIIDMNRELLERYFSDGQCTPEELAQIAEHLDRVGEPESFFFEQWKTASGPVAVEESESMWANIESRIPGKGRRLYGSRRRWIAVAAAVLGVILVSGVVYQLHKRDMNAVAGSWKKIDNTSKEIKYIRLGDGTEVWLNLHSSMAYHEEYFYDGKREIKLEGEAFFEVAQDAAHPFTVDTRQLRTTVLGTSFDIRAWPSLSRTQIALVSGKVRVDAILRGAGIAAGMDPVVLSPGDLLNYDSGAKQFAVAERSMHGDMTGWIKGKIVLDNTLLPDILQQLEQLYNVSISFDAGEMSRLRLSGQFRRDGIEDVLKNVLFPLDLTYSYENGKYVVHQVKHH